MYLGDRGARKGFLGLGKRRACCIDCGAKANSEGWEVQKCQEFTEVTSEGGKGTRPKNKRMIWTLNGI
jgi:hypothetical protein